MAAHVHYSVCPTSTADIKTGSPTITISSGEATLSVAQTGNIGCGYEIDYDTDNKICYIGDPTKPTGSAADNLFAGAMTSATVFEVVTAIGGTPGNVTAKTVNSISAVWASLSAAEAAYLGASYVNNASLVAADVVVHLWCYGGATADTTKATISGATTDATRYLDIRVPWGLTTYGECILGTNYHWGVWDTTAYRLEITDAAECILLSDNYVHLDGIQVESKSTDNFVDAINCAGTVFFIDNVIAKDTAASGTKHYGIYFDPPEGASPTHIRNYIGYNFTAEPLRGGGVTSSYGTLIANVTCYNSGRDNTEDGIELDYRCGNALNCLVYTTTNSDYGAGFGGGSDPSGYNFSEDGTEPGVNGGSNSVDGWTPDFVNTGSGTEDFRLQATSDAIGNGAGPTTDADCPALDIAGNVRSGATCDIGAHQYVAAGGLSIPVARHHYSKNILAG